MSSPADAPAGILIREVDDERTPLAAHTISLFERTFDPRDRHAPTEMRSEIAEKRMQLLAPFNFHLLVAVDGDELVGGIMGRYLAGVNAGFVNYLAVEESYRGHGIGRLLRPRLISLFEEDSRNAEYDGLAWVIGEVRLDNPWLRRLVRNRGAIPFDLTYYHPGMRPSHGAPAYVLYRQPFTDFRVELPTELVRRLLYTIYRRAYRVGYPLMHDAFTAMLDEVQGRQTIGCHPDFVLPGTNE